MRSIGPLRVIGDVEGEFQVPLATFESPLWPSTRRGARVSVLAGGIQTTVMDDRMTRSVLLEAPDAQAAREIWQELRERRKELEDVVRSSSRFARLVDLHAQWVGHLLFIRFEMETGDAAGHNMVTAAADQLLNWLVREYPSLTYVSISGNYCTDKKVSAVNGILGRGKYVIAEAVIPESICRRHLKTTPGKIVDLNVRKNLLGSTLAGGVRSANAHFANMLLGLYLATGQDAANIIEGSQGITHAEMRGDDLYFSVTLPNIIVGTVGSGKDLEFVRENLEQLGCLEDRAPGENARRLAAIAAATVWCGELSLLAAQTNPGELMKAHLKMERS